ncbi:MAG: hypothetical protein AVDCRST_MAG93-4715, partial [uncultured Chloroflexia bacterium]
QQQRRRLRPEVVSRLRHGMCSPFFCGGGKGL